MMYVGLDVHKSKTTVACLDAETGELRRPYSVPTGELPEHLSAMPGELRIVMEAGSSSFFVARQLRSCGLDARVVDAYKAHRVAESFRTSKTDKIDAEMLARRLADGCLAQAEVWVPDGETRELRELTRVREELTRLNVTLRNFIRTFLLREGQVCPYSDLTGKSAGEWLDALARTLPEALREVLARLRGVLEYLGVQIKELSAVIAGRVNEHPDGERLQTIPGVGPQTAAAIVAEVGDVERFESARKLRGYSGLVPLVKQSGDRSHTGPLVKRGNRHLRRAMVWAAQHFAQSSRTKDLGITRWYRRLVYKHGPNPAKVALGRRLLDIVFAMLRDGTAFDPRRHLVQGGT